MDSTEQATVDEFKVPPRYVFESPFEASPPRPFPERFHQGERVLRARHFCHMAVATALVCFSGQHVPFVRVVALYILPLAYLNWIALALLMGAAVTWLRQSRLAFSEHAIVRNGKPLVGRIVAAQKACTVVVNGVSSRYAIVAAVEYLDRDKVEHAVVKSVDFSVITHEQYSTSLVGGEYVTLVWHGGKPHIYGFLDVDPETRFVFRDTNNKASWFTACVYFASAFCLVWDVYAMDFYRASGVPTSAEVSMLAGAAVLAAVVYATLRRLRRTRSSSAGRAILGAFFVLVMSYITVRGMTLTVNAQWDKSPASYVPIVITNYTATTRNFVWRDYQIEYHTADNSEPRQQSVTPLQMDRLDSSSAVQEVHAGYFGWPWVKDILPPRE